MVQDGIMELHIKNVKIECSDLKTCGEIAILLSPEKSEFFLNCGFCEYTFLQMENFIQHMYEDHICEFSPPELKQEPCEVKEYVDEEDAAQENYEDEFVLKDFERVEIELDTAEIGTSLDIKEDISEEFFDEEIQVSGQSSKVDASKKVSGTNLRHRKKCEIKEEKKFDNRDGPGDSDLLIEIGETKRISETAYDRQRAHRSSYNLDENQDTNNYEDSDEAYMQKDDEIDGVSKIDSQRTNSNREALKEAGETEIISGIGRIVPHAPHRNSNQFNEKETNNFEGPNDDDVRKEVLETESAPAFAALNKTQGKSKPENKKVTTTDSLLDDRQCIILAEIYKSHPCLWNENDIAYRFGNRRNEALEAVYTEFNAKTGLNLAHLDLEKEVFRLRKICSNEKKMKIASKLNKLVYKTACTYYDDIAFLEVDVPPFECSICEKLLPGLGQLKVHLASHDGSLPFKCPICGHGFQIGSNLTVHLRRHAQDYMYNCEVCNKPCATSTERKIHMRSHTGEKPFVCYMCGKKFLTSSHLLLHTMRHEKRTRHKCKFCSKTFYETGTLKEHLLVHNKLRDNICNVCGKGFKSKKQLGQHKLIHDADKKYVCKVCGKRFAQSAGLCGHMKSHGPK
ncbi:zinc finger protein 808-like isoform X2 [Anastrepha obliqua]|uniref:zinc finger protein 808-like isoform X2 n=1 Tax=Anastrepha obliqua TaxID=95512 RepID=UPI002409515C|nr:zinc finger protein 808-like isoform X2 [Anastrepha obliqua]